ncbi:MAG: hypothetical protein ABSE63_02625, partial [Thermoguttaceae bacterium]
SAVVISQYGLDGWDDVFPLLPFFAKVVLFFFIGASFAFYVFLGHLTAGHGSRTPRLPGHKCKPLATIGLHDLVRPQTVSHQLWPPDMVAGHIPLPAPPLPGKRHVR